MPASQPRPSEGTDVVSAPRTSRVPRQRDGSAAPAAFPSAPLAPGGPRRHGAVLADLHVQMPRLLAEGLGTCRLRLVPAPLDRVVPDVLLVSTPQGAHDVLTGGAGVDKGGPGHDVFRALSPNIFNVRHAAWLPRKRALQPVFTKPRMAQYAAAISAVMGETTQQWASAGRFDLQAECRRLTSEVLGRSLLGRSLGDRAEELAQDFDALTGLLVDRATSVLRPPTWVPTPGLRRYRAAEARSLALCDEALEQARQDPDRDAPLLRRLLEATDPETGRPMTAEERRNDLLTFVMAGHDTTATLLTYALWQLGREPAWQQAVADEAAALGSRPIVPADVAALPVTVRVLHEALRICPPGPMLIRKAMQEHVVDGYRVLPGQVLIVSVVALHHDDRAWPDPQRFDPDRFLPAASRGRSRWQYLPFGGGSRACIGDHFAMLEATVALASLVRDLEVSSEGDYVPSYDFTTTSSQPVPVQVVPRR